MGIRFISSSFAALWIHFAAQLSGSFFGYCSGSVGTVPGFVIFLMLMFCSFVAIMFLGAGIGHASDLGLRKLFDKLGWVSMKEGQCQQAKGKVKWIQRQKK